MSVCTVIVVRKIVSLFLISLFVGILPTKPVEAVAYPQKRVSWSEAPYVAAIFYNDEPGYYDPQMICTGSLIDELHVLTAAHCVSDTYPENILVGFGATGLNDVLVYGVADYEQHLRYIDPTSNNDVSLSNDIAILRLTERVVGVKPVKVPIRTDAGFRSNKDGMAIYGWGVDQNGRPNEKLGYAKQRDYSTTGTKYFPKFNKGTQIAAGLSIKKEKIFAGACSGDSGGPLIGFDKKRVPYVIGVVSFGSAGCRSGTPSVFTRVLAYKNWINTAKRTMEERYLDQKGVYALDDLERDATGGSSSMVDIYRGGVVVSAGTTFVAGEVVSHNSLDTYKIIGAIFQPGSETIIGYINNNGFLKKEDYSVLCPPTDVDLVGPQYSMLVDTQCVIANFGTTVDILFGLNTSDDSRDYIFFEGINLLTL